MNPALDITYEQHKAFLERVYCQAEAELDGFLDAANFDTPNSCYSPIPRVQDIYAQGFRDGKAKLEQDRQSRCAGYCDLPLDHSGEHQQAQVTP